MRSALVLCVEHAKKKSLIIIQQLRSSFYCHNTLFIGLYLESMHAFAYFVIYGCLSADSNLSEEVVGKERMYKKEIKEKQEVLLLVED